MTQEYRFKQIVEEPNIELKYVNLEERTFQFAKSVRLLTKKLPKNTANIEDIKQVVRASGSVGANYIEANESLSKADFSYRIKICRKESKEATYWLRLFKETNDEKLHEECNKLINESFEIRKIFAAIYSKIKTEKKN